MIFSKVCPASSLCTGNRTWVTQPLLIWSFLTSYLPEGIFISLVISSEAEELGGPYRIFLVTILSLSLSFLKGKTNPFQLVINHFLILKELPFYFYGGVFKEPSPSNLEACQPVNLILAYVILREDTHMSLGVRPCLICNGSGWLFIPLNCLLQTVFKKKITTVLFFLKDGEKKSITFQGDWKCILPFFLDSLWKLQICTSAHNL